jgi:hypothetical protein
MPQDPGPAPGSRPHGFEVTSDLAHTQGIVGLAACCSQHQLVSVHVERDDGVEADWLNWLSRGERG